jgi:hypothetical protein
MGKPDPLHCGNSAQSYGNSTSQIAVKSSKAVETSYNACRYYMTMDEN